MIERVRPAQFTMILVVGSRAISRMRYGSSAFGQQMPPGMFIFWYSAKGRPSTMTKFSPRSLHARELLHGHARRVVLVLDELAEESCSAR